ncbi:helix-turn-helix domain-containing protein [Pseudonocardia sp. MH-G8]|uniref:helix-turn-helix domain-containing protein n=1 Tax=Pseudonocardia sp. MH-G8 TaxID=1854588 RepID=UPI001E3BA1A6|nr:helix-turn-helix transcriptional regulator [Pseudonocardia sp. MH-G8]
MSDLGGNLRAAREAAGLSLSALAGRMHFSKSLLGLLETGKRTVAPEHVRAYAKALDVPVEQLHDAGPPDAMDDHDGRWSARAAPLDAEYVECLRARTRTLIDLEIQFGGDQPAAIARGLFRSVHRTIGSAPRAPGVERELVAAAAELGELTGWLLYDAGEHALVRTANHEALHLSRLAGDTSMELLTLQNMSMHAVDRERPAESLGIARMVLDTARLSPRLEALFRIREARALAQLGDGSGAERAFRHARSLYLDGLRDDDPEWTWWINDHELAWHEAMIRADTADRGAAIDTLATSIASIPGREARRRYNDMANLLKLQALAAAWVDVQATITSIAPCVDEVRSTRTDITVLAALDTLGAADAPPVVREAARHLGNVVAGAGSGMPAG